MNALQLMPVPDLDALRQVIGIRVGDESDTVGPFAWRDVATEQFLRSDEQQVEVVVAGQVNQPPVGARDEAAQREHEARMTFQAESQLLDRDLLGDLDRPNV